MFEEINFKKIFQVLNKNKFLFLITTILCLGASYYPASKSIIDSNIAYKYTYTIVDKAYLSSISNLISIINLKQSIGVMPTNLAESLEKDLVIDIENIKKILKSQSFNKYLLSTISGFKTINVKKNKEYNDIYIVEFIFGSNIDQDEIANTLDKKINNYIKNYFYEKLRIYSYISKISFESLEFAHVMPKIDIDEYYGNASEMTLEKILYQIYVGELRTKKINLSIEAIKKNIENYNTFLAENTKILNLNLKKSFTKKNTLLYNAILFFGFIVGIFFSILIIMVNKLFKTK